LTSLGYLTKKSDLENAVRPNSKLVSNLVPCTPVVENFLARILERFPAFQSEQILLPATANKITVNADKCATPK
jgi:hypothetical protein